MIRKIAFFFITFCFIWLWLYAGLMKLHDYRDFKFQLGQSPYVFKFANPLSVLLPIGEILIAVALIWNRSRLLGLYLSFFLMLVFTGYIYSMLHYSYFIPCSCGGIFGKMSWNAHLRFNIIATICAFLAILLDGGYDAKSSSYQLTLLKRFE